MDVLTSTPAPRRARARALRHLGWPVAALVLLAAPLVLDRAEVFLVIEIVVLALFASSFNLLFGYTGLVSFGHAAYFGVGAYTLGLLLKRYDAPFLLALLAAPALSTLFAAVIGWFSVRTVRLYFSLLTLAFGQLLWAVAFEWYGFTGGSDGIQGIPRPAPLQDLTAMYYFVLAVVAGCLALLWVLVNSPFGWALKAIRDNSHRAQFLGINERRYKLIAFAIAGGLSGVAGALFALFQGFADPGLLDWTRSAEPVFMSLAGGMHVFLGPAVGALTVTVLRKGAAGFTEYWPLVYGLVLLALVIWLPEGIVGFLVQRWRAWRPGETARAAEGEPSSTHPRLASAEPAAPAEPARVDGRAVLQTEGLAKRFGGLRATDDVSLQVHPGSIHAIIGPNGAGKTTLFNLITGHYVPDAGRVVFDAQEITGKPPYEISRRGLTRAFQVINVFPRFTVLESVQLALMASRGRTLEFFSPAARLLREEAMAVLREVGLADQAGVLVGTLSHGDQRTLELAIALAGTPRLLLLDEPAAGMAPWERAQLVGLIRRLVRERGITVLFCEHDMDIVFGLADRITVLHQGRVIAAGTVDQVRQNPEVQAVYLGEAGGIVA